MPQRLRLLLCFAATCACGEAADPNAALPGAGQRADARPGGDEPGVDAAGSPCPGTQLTEIGPLRADDGRTDAAASGDAPRFVRFVDPTSGCVTDQVHDADREVVFFDNTLGAMVSLEEGNAVSGWTVDGADLDWSRSGVRFRVRFGTEDGARRAYFTEAGPGTICDLSVAGPDVLFISATSQTPPNP